MKILLLGQNGMLGHIVHKYMLEKGYTVDLCNYRWPSIEFKKYIQNSNAKFLINCIGSIPQKNNNHELFFSCNTDLPIFLAKNFKGQIIHPTTDCEFFGSSDSSFFYKKNDLQDAKDSYGQSKILATQQLIAYANVKIIRTSIIGPEILNKKSLWEWFINCDHPNGFIAHYWNGLTTLQWAKEAEKQMIDFNNELAQIGSNKVSKFQLLNILNEELRLNKNIKELETNVVNKCLVTDYLVPDIRQQIKDQIKWQKL